MKDAPNARELRDTDDSRPRAVDGGSRDVDDHFAQIGLTPKTGWIVAAGMYFVCGVLPLVAHLLAPDKIGKGALLGILPAFILAPLSIVGYKRFPNAVWGTHTRLITGMMLIGTGALMVGEASQAFSLMLLSSSVPPAVYFGVRRSIPYMFAVAAEIGALMLMSHDPWAGAMAICSAVAAITVASSMIVAQSRTRRFARIHRSLAFSDPLTGLANTRALREAIERSVATASSGGKQFALYAIDLDNFKQVNDLFDHARGDEVLKAVAEELTAVAGPGDLVARRGGDEFSLLITDPSGRDLNRFSEHLAKAINIARLRTCPEISPSGSAAVVLSEDGDDANSLLIRADEALHEKKAAFHVGRVDRARPRLAIIDQRTEDDRMRHEVINDDESVDRRLEAGSTDEGSRWRGDPTVDRGLWRFVAVFAGALAATIGGVAFIGLTGELSPTNGVLIATGFSLIAVASWAASTVSLRAKFIHVAFAAEIVLLTAAVLMAGPSGAALIDLFAIIAMAAFHFFAPSVAARYLPITVGLYGYLAINGGFPFGGVRTATFGLMMLLCATLIGKVRIVTRQFILQNAELSQRDALTAAANVRAMRLRVSEAVKTAAAGEREPAVIAIDLDGFKQVNDTFSHSVGDEMLVAVTRAIFDSVREEDMVARRGGDEFVVVTDAVAVTELDAIARRVGSAISESRSRIAPGLQSTASVAVAVWGQGDSANDLLRRADEQLHKNKVAVRDSEQLLVG